MLGDPIATLNLRAPATGVEAILVRDTPAEVVVPAAIAGANAASVEAQLVLEAANLPVAADAEAARRPGTLPRQAAETLAVATLEKDGVAHNRRTTP